MLAGEFHASSSPKRGLLQAYGGQMPTYGPTYGELPTYGPSYGPLPTYGPIYEQVLTYGPIYGQQYGRKL